MKAEITDILYKVNPTGQEYIRVKFKTIPESKFRVTDLVPGFRNFVLWERYLKKGNVLEDLKQHFFKDTHFDADVEPRLVKEAAPCPVQMTLFE